MVRRACAAPVLHGASHLGGRLHRAGQNFRDGSQIDPFEAGHHDFLQQAIAHVQRDERGTQS